MRSYTKSVYDNKYVDKDYIFGVECQKSQKSFLFYLYKLCRMCNGMMKYVSSIAAILDWNEILCIREHVAVSKNLLYVSLPFSLVMQNFKNVPQYF